MSPLSCILNQKYRIIIGCRSLIVNGRMTTFKIVGMNIFPNRFPCFTDIGILGKICFLIFETPEPSFNHDIVSPAAFTIHALTDLVLFEKIHILIACKLNRSPSSRQLKKYKFFLPAEIYLLAVFMRLASKFRVFPLVLKFRDSFVSVYCYSNLYNLRSFLREYLYQ